MSQDFTTTFAVEAAPSAVFAAINDVRSWWGEGVEGRTDALDEEFTFRVEGVHDSRLRIVELVPDEKIAWRVISNWLGYVEDQHEWVGTTIRFELRADGAQTEVRFTHVGLVADAECYDVCSNAWSSLMHASLPDRIRTGAGHPYPRRLPADAA